MLKHLKLPCTIDERAKILGEFIAQTGATVRCAAKRFGISKSTVHKDVSKRLKNVDLELFSRVSEILNHNRAERHIRGGMATKNKYRAKETEKAQKG